MAAQCPDPQRIDWATFQRILCQLKSKGSEMGFTRVQGRNDSSRLTVILSLCDACYAMSFLPPS
jgi:hypothetical protein